MQADPVRDRLGFTENSLRGVSVAFGEDEVAKVCQLLDIDIIVRAHQVVQNGYEFFADRKLVTLFSAPKYENNHSNRFAEDREDS